MKSPEVARQEFLSVGEVADRYAVSSATVHAWIAKRTGPRSYKIGRYRRFRIDDVLAWEASRADDYDEEHA